MYRTRRLILTIAALIAALPATLPAIASAIGDTQPLVIIRFNQTRVYYDQQLYTAIASAVEIKPDVVFDVISYAPTTGNAQKDKEWQGIASRNTQSVIATMQDIGVPMSRINITGLGQSGLKHDETQIFVR